MARLPFAHSGFRYNNASTTWTFGDAFNLGCTNAFSPISGTHQPYGFDQMAALYRFYKVIGFKYKITAMLQNQVSAAPAVALAVREVPVNENLALTGAGLARILEAPGTKVAFTNLGTRPCTIRGEVDIPKLLGVTPEQYSADVSQYAALCTAAPTRYPYVQIGIAGSESDISSSATYAYVVVECEYIVHFWQRITQAQS